MAKAIDVDLGGFRIDVTENGAVVRSIRDLSIGRATHRTPVIANGALHPTKRNANHRSSRYPPPKGGAPMNFALFFRERPACAFHEGSTRVASHGCIHLTRADAQWLFTWAGHDAVGLTIRGPYPNRSVPPGSVAGERPTSREFILSTQRALEAADFDVGEVDGSFGPSTEDAVMDFQAARGLTPDGIVGPRTAAALGIALP